MYLGASPVFFASKPSILYNDLFPRKAVFDNSAGNGHFEELCNVLAFRRISI